MKNLISSSYSFFLGFTFKPFLLFTFVLLVISSCQKDEGEPIIFSDQEVILRTSNDNCGNLIRNPSFEDGPPINNAFATPGVPNWDCYSLSPDVVGPGWSWENTYPFSFWANYNITENLAFMCVGKDINGLHVEGITQDVNIVAGVDYCFTFDLASTAFPFDNNGNLTLYMQYGTNLPTFCGVQGVPSCDLPSNCMSFPISQINEFPNLANITANFTAVTDASTIYFWVESDWTIIGPAWESCGAFVDNFLLNCHNDNIATFDITPGSQSGSESPCEFTFTPNYTDLALVVGQLWQFGDGNFSLDQTPTHTYAEPGMYEVTLIATDLNGCCTELTQTVTCFPECTYICHEELIGSIRCVNTVHYTDPSTNSQQQIYLGNNYSIYDFANLAARIELELTNLGYNVSVDITDPMGNVDCTKASLGYTYGYFINGDVIVTQLAGHNSLDQNNNCKPSTDNIDRTPIFNNCP